MRLALRAGRWHQRIVDTRCCMQLNKLWQLQRMILKMRSKNMEL